MATKIDLVLNTKDKPSFRLFKIGSPILGFKIGFFFIENVSNKAKKTDTKTKANELLIPTQAIEKPANAGPTTAANCHVELLHEAAFGYVFFVTIRATNEKMIGPKKLSQILQQKLNYI